MMYYALFEYKSVGGNYFVICCITSDIQMPMFHKWCRHVLCSPAPASMEKPSLAWSRRP